MPGDTEAGTSVRSPSAGNGGSHRDVGGRAAVLDQVAEVEETGVDPRELRSRPVKSRGETLTSLRGVFCCSRSGWEEDSLNNQPTTMARQDQRANLTIKQSPSGSVGPAKLAQVFVANDMGLIFDRSSAYNFMGRT